MKERPPSPRPSPQGEGDSPAHARRYLLDRHAYPAIEVQEQYQNAGASNLLGVEEGAKSAEKLIQKKVFELVRENRVFKKSQKASGHWAEWVSEGVFLGNNKSVSILL